MAETKLRLDAAYGRPGDGSLELKITRFPDGGEEVSVTVNSVEEYMPRSVSFNRDDFEAFVVRVREALGQQ